MAAGNTYTPIATQTLNSNQTTVSFTSIPGTYTDLVLVVVGWSTQAGTSSNGLWTRFNSDTGTNYSNTYLYADGTNVLSGKSINLDYAYLGQLSQTSATSPTMSVTHIMNYANTTTFKTALTKEGRGDGVNSTYANLWRSTNAITRIDLQRDGTNQIKSGTIFTLYGITAA